MKQIRLKFVGMGAGYNITNNIFVNAIKDKYEIIYDDENPDYIICSMSGRPFEYLKYCGVRIFYSGENVSPDFNYVDYAVGFDKLRYGDRFCRNPKILGVGCREQLPRLSERPKFTLDSVKQREGFCNFIYSHDRDDYKRREIFNLLNGYKRVDSLGTYLNNMTDGTCVSMANKLDYQKNYKFTIAFDSVDLDGFITEKIADGFLAGTIPIYLGDPSVCEIYNRDAFINCADYSSFNEVLDRVIYLDQNDEAYLQMLNEPVYAKDFNPEKMFDDFDMFINNIFEQSYENAFRRCSGPSIDVCGALCQYESHLRFYSEIYDNLFVRLLRKCMKIISKNRGE